MGLLNRFIRRNEESAAAATPVAAALSGVRDEQIPNSLDLGWYFSEGKQEVQMAKVAQEDRATHAYVIGATGTGKTKFLEFLIEQDIQQGNGFAIIDPHGDLVEDIKGLLACCAQYLGDEVFNRVVIVDPTDPNYTVGFNPLERLPGVSVVEQAQELISTFRKIWADSWGSRMEDLLRNSLIALGEAGLTLVELPQFLTSQGFRRSVLEKVGHPIAKDYFQRFDALTERARITWIEPVTNKINALLADERVRQLFASPKSTFQLRDVMDSGKVLLVKLDKGRLRDSADLLGSLILAKIKMTAFSRSDVSPQQRRPFHLYIDEFQNFATDSFSVMLSESRKYGLSLVMAHQTLAQVPSDLRSLILGNTGIQVYFRVGHHDAQILANEAFVFSGREATSSSGLRLHYRGPGEQRQLLAQDIQDLPPRVCYVKHKIAGGLIMIQTVDLEPPWEQLGVDEADYQEYLVNLPLGRKYVIERDSVDRGVVERAKSTAAVTGSPVRDGSSGIDAKPPDLTTAVPLGRDEVATGQEHLVPGRGQHLPVRSSHQDRVTQAPVHKELTTYLEHIAENPFLPALQRDEALDLSRYKGSTIRRQLVDAGYIKLHKVGTGTRSGQVVLQEITGAGYELLASMKIRVHKPKSRGGFLHKYYCQKLKEFAEVTWEGCVANIEDGSLGKYADVTVRMPKGSNEETPSVIAFEVFMTGEAKEIRGIAKGVEVFDRVVVCAENRSSLESLKRKSVEALGSEILERVSFHLVSQYLTTWTPEGVEVETSKLPRKPLAAPTTKVSIPNPELSPIQGQIPLKSPAKSEAEVEHKPRPGKRRGRPPKTPLMEQVEQAYTHLNDLDALQESALTRLDAVQERIQPRQAMPEAQALRSLLMEAAQEIIKDMGHIPGKEGLGVFLERWLEGKQVSEIAQELRVTRETCSRNYRREGLRLAAMQFISSNG